MNPDILELIRQERLLDAAELASVRGQAGHASALFERACAWTRAAEEALVAREPRRALDLALQAGDNGLAERALAAVVAEPATAGLVAAHLEQRGHSEWAARILEATGPIERAAHAWERAGDAVRAGVLFERLGDATRAVKVLEAALRRQPNAAAASVALGALLVRLGKDEAAVRVLQRVGRNTPERREALAHLVDSLEHLGFAAAAREAATELATLGGPDRPAAAPREAKPLLAKTETRLFGRYEVRAEIASSPSARVLDCLDRVRGERVVVKLFIVSEAGAVGQRARARFEHDVRALAALDHPHVVPVRELLADVPATVLARMEGGTLDSLLARGPLAPSRAVEIACALLEALAEGQRLGILHLDVKPSNVLFDAAGSARLGDFGAAHLRDLSATATAGTFRSLAYESPEAREGHPATAQSDVFAVGVLLQEMLRGQGPGPAPLVSVSAAHPELDGTHQAVIAHLAARDPAMRPADAFAARAALRGLVWPSTARPATSAQPVVRTPGGRPREERLEASTDGADVDTWTGHAIERVPLSDMILVRARAFALADHSALQSVLRVDRKGGTVWLLAARGPALHRPLSANERARLAEALEALHAVGSAHGAVDAAHVTIDERSGVLLRFAPIADAKATVDGDRQALALLAPHP